jgi:type I restriction enzyme, S subunit
LEVRPGYRQTEAGVIPEDWELKTIRDLGAIKTGPFGTLLKASEYSESDGVPVISVGEIREGYFRITEETPRVSEIVTRRLPQFVLLKGDIAFGRKGGVDRSALVREEQERWFLGSDGIRMRPTEHCHDAFLAFQFQSQRVQRWLLQHSTGTTMPSLNQQILEKVVIPLPPTKAEQEAIAEALSDADAHIESLDQLITKKRHLKQGAMQELLSGKSRLPGFSGERSTKRLSDLASLSKVAINPASIPHRQFTHYSLPAFDEGQVPTLETGEEIGSIKFLVPPKAVLVSKLNPRIPRVWAPSHVSDDAICSTEFLVLVPRENTDRDFLAALCSSPAVCYQMELQATGTTGSHQRIPPSVALAIEALIPNDIAEQIAIAAVLSDTDAELAALESELSKARQVKQGMMQELLTGRIRLV